MTSRSDQELRQSALVFYAEDIEAIEAILDAFLKKSGARCGLLVDQDGHTITARGQTEDVDLDTISALVAGSFAATRQLARQFGEREFSALFHQGKGGNIQLSLVGERALLTSLFDDTTTVGMVRLYASEAVKRLSDIFRRKSEQTDESDAEVSVDAESFGSESRGALDDILGGD